MPDFIYSKSKKAALTTKWVYCMVALYCIVLTSCTTRASKSVVHSSRYDSVAIIASDSLVGVGRPETQAERAEQGALPGAGVGVLSGALVGSAACGPIFYGFCVAGYVGIGAAMGILGGASYGFTGVSKTDELYLIEAMSYVAQERDIQLEFASLVRLKTPEDIQAPPELAQAQAMARIEGVTFTQQTRKNIQVKVSATLMLAARNNTNDQPIARKYSSTSQPINIDTLLVDDGKKLETIINQRIAELADNISHGITVLIN